MSSSPSATERDKKAVLKKHENTIRDRGLWDDARADVTAEIGRTYLDTGELRTARRYLRQAVSLDDSVRRWVLLFLSYTHPQVVTLSVSFKRQLATWLSSCSERELTAGTIPGLHE